MEKYARMMESTDPQLYARIVYYYFYRSVGEGEKSSSGVDRGGRGSGLSAGDWPEKFYVTGINYCIGDFIVYAKE